MQRLCLRLLMVILCLYLAGSVYPLFATVGGHGTTSSPPPAPLPSAPPTPPSSSPAQLGGGSQTPGGPPTLSSGYGGGGCGGGSSGGSGVLATAPPSPPPGEIASTDTGPVTLPPDSSPYKGPPLPPPPGSEVKEKGGEKKHQTYQQGFDKLTSELSDNLRGGDVSDAQLTQQVNSIKILLTTNPNLKLSPQFISDLNQYEKNLKNQRAADRQEYEIYHNTIIKFDNLAKDARKDAITNITGAMVGEISKLSVHYGPLGIPLTAAESSRKSRNAEIIANDFKNITNAVEARKKAEYLRESMSLRIKNIDRRLKILQPLLR